MRRQSPILALRVHIKRRVGGPANIGGCSWSLAGNNANAPCGLVTEPVMLGVGQGAPLGRAGEDEDPEMVLTDRLTGAAGKTHTRSEHFIGGEDPYTALQRTGGRSPRSQGHRNHDENRISDLFGDHPGIGS